MFEKMHSDKHRPRFHRGGAVDLSEGPPEGVFCGSVLFHFDAKTVLGIKVKNLEDFPDALVNLFNLPFANLLRVEVGVH